MILFSFFGLLWTWFRLAIQWDDTRVTKGFRFGQRWILRYCHQKTKGKKKTFQWPFPYRYGLEEFERVTSNVQHKHSKITAPGWGNYRKTEWNDFNNNGTLSNIAKGIGLHFGKKLSRITETLEDRVKWCGKCKCTKFDLPQNADTDSLCSFFFVL